MALKLAKVKVPLDYHTTYSVILKAIASLPVRTPSSLPPSLPPCLLSRSVSLFTFTLPLGILCFLPP